MASQEEEADFYEVETILDRRELTPNIAEYLIKWKGYDEAHNTWEPEGNLNCPELFIAFNKKIDQKKRKKKKKQNKTKGSTDLFNHKSVKRKGTDAKDTSGFEHAKTKIQKLESSNKSEHEKQIDNSTLILNPHSASNPIDTESNANNKTHISNEVTKSSNLDSSSVNKNQQPVTNAVNDKQTIITNVETQHVLTEKSAATVLEKKDIRPSVTVEKTNKQPITISHQKPHIEKKPQDVLKDKGKQPLNMNYQRVQIPDILKKGKIPVTNDDISSKSSLLKTAPLEFLLKNTERLKSASSPSLLNKPPPITKPHELGSSNASLSNSSATASVIQGSSTTNPFNIIKENRVIPASLIGKPSSLQTSLQKSPKASSPQAPVHMPKILPSSAQKVFHQPAPSLPNKVLPSVQAEKKLTQTWIKPNLPQSRDPRLHPEKRFRREEIPTPFTLNVTLCKGETPIAPIALKGDQKCFHKDAILNLIEKQAKLPGHLHITHCVPLGNLNKLINGRKISLMDILLTGPLVGVSKLKSFLQINEQAGITCDEKDMGQVIAFVPVTELYKLPNIPSDNGLLPYYHQLCAIFIDNVEKAPEGLGQISYVIPEGNNVKFSWENTTQYFKFPPKFQHFKENARFVIYGDSKDALLLSEMIKSLPSTNPKFFVMLFDRYNEKIFSHQLTNRKKEKSTVIIEFGVSELNGESMKPPEVVFPYKTGGFVTTDAENVLERPQILTEIFEKIEMLNSDPKLQGEWKFVLPSNFFNLLKDIVETCEEAEVALNLGVQLTVALTQSKITMIETFPNTCCSEDFMEQIAREYYKKHEFFVVVDDIQSTPNTERPCFIDFVSSRDLCTTFI